MTVFRVIQIDSRIPEKGLDTAYLTIDNWNDYSFKTLFRLNYFDHDGINHEIGYLKIGFKGQKEVVHTSSQLESVFEDLNSEFFALGQTVKFYEEIAELGEKGKNILEALNDVVKNPEIIKTIEDEEVFSTSLLRDMSLGVVEGQFARVLAGGNSKSNFHFSFKREESDSLGSIELDFQVNVKSFPPTNVHALIGRNGVGKTTIFNTMVDSITKRFSSYSDPGIFLDRNKNNSRISPNYFGRVASVSFSPFDPFEPPNDENDPAKGTSYTYIGLKSPEHKHRNSSPLDIRRQAVEALVSCFENNAKKKNWFKAMDRISVDRGFSEMNLSGLYDSYIESKEQNRERKDSDHHVKEHLTYLISEMSSGHSIVFSSLTRLIDCVEDQTLVLIDEPESHLHPPLLALFIGALSELLVEQNGVAILATHSPVVLQEIPKSCVWILDRSGKSTECKEPKFETFAENVGFLTREVFTLELRKTGYYSIFDDLVSKGKSFDEIIEIFKDNLGMEGRAVLLSKLTGKEKDLSNDSTR